MTDRMEKVRVLDDTPRRFTADGLDPRNAESVQARDGMIAMRHAAGLPDYPGRPLYPDREVRFEPEPGQATRSNLVAE